MAGFPHIGAYGTLRPWTLDLADASVAAGIPNGAYWANAQRIITPGGVLCSKLSFGVNTQSGNMALALYADNGANVPGTLIAQTGSFAVPVGGNTIATVSLGGSYQISNGMWIALTCDNVTAEWLCGGQPAGVIFPTWRTCQWNNGSLVFASNPASISPANRLFAIWGEL